MGRRLEERTERRCQRTSDSSAWSVIDPGVQPIDFVSVLVRREGGECLFQGHRVSAEMFQNWGHPGTLFVLPSSHCCCQPIHVLVELAAVLKELERHGIRLEPKKAYVGFPEVSLLGQRVDALGLSTPDEKLKAITSLSFPDTLQKLETYIGMTGDLRLHAMHCVFSSQHGSISDLQACNQETTNNSRSNPT